MQGDDVEFFDRFLQSFGYAARDEGVGETVEAVFAESVMLGYLLVDGVGPDVCGNRGVESAVEEGDVCGLWELIVDGTDDSQSTCVVSMEEEC